MSLAIVLETISVKVHQIRLSRLDCRAETVTQTHTQTHTQTPSSILTYLPYFTAYKAPQLKRRTAGF